MFIESLIPTTASIAGGFFIGITLGYFIKKVIKILTFVTGGILALLLYLQQQQIISVEIEKLEASSTLIVTSIASSFDKLVPLDDITSIAILLTASMTAGFTFGVLKG